MSIQEIKAAVARMRPSERAEFAAWFDQLQARESEEPERARIAEHINALREFREGLALGEDVTVRELIEEGRI